MKLLGFLFSSITAAGLVLSTATAQENEDNLFDGISYHEAPYTAKIGTRAEIKITTENAVWLDKKNTATYMTRLGNFSSPNELGCIVGQYGFAVFDFDDIGYVKDDEKDNLDADDILDSIKKGTEEDNKRRAKIGAPPLNITGWYKKPYYNSDTNYLEWIIEADSHGTKIVNVNTRILGRKGVMNVTLVADVETLEEALKEYNQWLSEFSFSSGEKYAEYRDGDKVSEYGLTALITGASAFVLIKYWKAIVAAIVAVGVAIKRFFTGKKSSKDEES